MLYPHKYLKSTTFTDGETIPIERNGQCAKDHTQHNRKVSGVWSGGFIYVQVNGTNDGIYFCSQYYYVEFLSRVFLYQSLVPGMLFCPSSRYLGYSKFWKQANRGPAAVIRI